MELCTNHADIIKAHGDVKLGIGEVGNAGSLRFTSVGTLIMLAELPIC